MVCTVILEYVVAVVCTVAVGGKDDFSALAVQFFRQTVAVSFPLGMNRITLLLLVLITVLGIVNSKPFLEQQNSHSIEKRSIFGLSAFVLSLLNAILAISLNTSINRQNAEHGGIVG